MNNDWLVTLKFRNMPSDADKESMEIFVNALVGGIMDETVEFQIVKIEKAAQ
jgi:hypothetical protein